MLCVFFGERYLCGKKKRLWGNDRCYVVSFGDRERGRERVFYGEIHDKLII
jgi:hypothetical protein